ncbi:MAG: hypothetical protein COU07_00650 [Candidatus Harrisonbacteria bacterium CG10_big_fil_rev_8_21_14_0_10_40_38]|uniref:DNA 3'-5' helicase n=1 Tax=Candidatus Harrisonbacteria bacterium CG10_big_fil_rev_8_21_14_0_10_40_38 TaxID=1974583 RepID=A0A2H0USK3_9BACT|nr:MAG: hypothetical protein COU07_00650 [Candidatus Harrisonbacteria bacterium CG10_big_fil_rev_8_21_14_0_10_40_38]
MKNFETRFANLNEAQKKAVSAIEGPVLVIAGPGSGKTEILSLRVANILDKTDTHPSNILCLTFTDSAAVTMRERLSGLIGRKAYSTAIYTFHSFCVDVIGRFPEYFYNGASFSPADTLTQIEIMQEIFENLPFDNPLRAYHASQGFIFLNPAIKAISNLKKAGLEPDIFFEILKADEDALKKINKNISVFDERLSMKQIDSLVSLCDSLLENGETETDFRYEPIGVSISKSLRRVIEEARETGKTAPLSKWKQTWTKKNDEGARVWRDSVNMEKLFALAEVYRAYREALHEKGFYDFEDMLLEVITSLEANPSLRYELQEQYQYILVDEFQDTNDAQMRLIEFLTDAPVHEGRPNIMAVGDDDQAIYKFQGADVSNILNFKKLFRDPEIVTLTHNYRSRQDILDLARYIIKKGSQRLEDKVLGISKELVAAGDDKGIGNIVSKSLTTSSHEYDFIAKEIEGLLKNGASPDSIAVIARHHSDLQALQPHLSDISIPVAYERQRDVLIEPHIRQLIVMARFVSLLLRKDMEESDYLLPEILSFPFWEIDRFSVWELSVAKHKNHSSWFHEMKNCDDKKIQNIADFFVELAAQAKYEPTEVILDALVGSHGTFTSTDEDDETHDKKREQKKFKSPFRKYYFGAEKFNEKKSEYLAFLSGLRVFYHALREYRHGQFLKVDDLVEFVDVHEKNHLQITDQSPFAAAQKAVHLLTAHKAKGLEFETVFVMSCQDDVWAGTRRANKISFPINLPIEPAGDTTDDQLRLFYVAITRAKKNLYLTSYEKNDVGRASSRLRFLANEDEEETPENLSFESAEIQNSEEILETQWKLHYTRIPFVSQEKAMLSALLTDYQMSVTHFNNFLDVSDGGPQKFFLVNFLRFPQAKTPSGSYGSAMHEAVAKFFVNFRQKQELPSSGLLLKLYENALKKERLADHDFSGFLEKGNKALLSFYSEHAKSFNFSDKIELDFKNQGVLVDETHLTGKLDRVVQKEDGTFEVHDFKTGKAVESWDDKEPYSRIKLHRFKYQLIFYKLLIENSRDFGGRHFVEKGIIDFFEPHKKKMISLTYMVQDADVQRVRKLISAVHKKILNLDFPDVSSYSKDLKGIIKFEDDLLTDFTT